MKDLVKSIKVKEKETHNLNKNLDNARLTIKSLKSESSKLKNWKTKLEADVKNLRSFQLRLKRRRKKSTDMKNQNKEVEEDSFLISSTCSSMISHWNLHNTKEFQILQRPDLGKAHHQSVLL